MNRNRLFVSVAAISLALALPATGDQPIYFSNAIGTNDGRRLVTFGTTMGAVTGSGVRNGVNEGKSYVAQLFWRDTEAQFRQVGPPAEFGEATTVNPGIWLGGIRTLEGVERGTPIYLTVVAWDAAFPDADSARSAGRPYGFSGIFLFQDKLSDPATLADISLDNFWGFQIGSLETRLPWDPIVPEPSTIALSAAGLMVLLWLPKKR